MMPAPAARMRCAMGFIALRRWSALLGNQILFAATAFDMMAFTPNLWNGATKNKYAFPKKLCGVTTVVNTILVTPPSLSFRTETLNADDSLHQPSQQKRAGHNDNEERDVGHMLALRFRGARLRASPAGAGCASPAHVLC